MKFRIRITIDASAEDVWKVVAHDFDKVADWLSVISLSGPKNDGAKPEGAPMAGRSCRYGNAKVDESFLEYDEDAKTFSYEAKIASPPPFLPIKRSISHWRVQESGPSQSILTIDGAPELNAFGILMYPIIKWNMHRLANQTMEELKWYLENGKPHPRNLK